MPRMKRVGLALLWLAAGVVGAIATLSIDLHAPGARLAGLAAGGVPPALVLVALVGRRTWALVMAAGSIALPLVEFAARPGVATLISPLAPTRQVFVSPPRSAYLGVWVAYFVAFGLIGGVLSACYLWPYLRPAWMWILYSVVAGFANGLFYYLHLVVPVPGVPGATLFVGGPIISAIGLALLWRWNASPPELHWPALPAKSRPDRPEEAASAYGSWIADLEKSLDPTKPGSP